MFDEDDEEKKSESKFLNFFSVLRSILLELGSVYWALLSIAISVIFVFTTKGDARAHSDDAFKTVVIAALLFICEKSVVNTWYAKRASQFHIRQNLMLKTALKEIWISGKMVLPLKYQGKPAYEAYSTTMARFVSDLTVTDTKIDVKGEKLSRELYQHFWAKILEAQKSMKLRKAECIKVFLTHSGSIHPWKGEFSYIASVQKQFCNFGGKIYRIFLHNPLLNESVSDYEYVMNRMIKDKAKVYYLNTSKYPHLKDEDFTLVSFGDQYYYMKWHIDTTTNVISSGRVMSCEIDIGKANFELDHWGIWENAVAAMMETPFDQHMKKDDLDKLSKDTVLSRRPTLESEEYKHMTTLP